MRRHSSTRAKFPIGLTAMAGLCIASSPAIAMDAHAENRTAVTPSVRRLSTHMVDAKRPIHVAFYARHSVSPKDALDRDLNLVKGVMKSLSEHMGQLLHRSAKIGIATSHPSHFKPLVEQVVAATQQVGPHRETLVAVGTRDGEFGQIERFTSAARETHALGGSFVVVGYPRSLRSEENLEVNHKARAAVKAGLVPIICFGETQKQRDRQVGNQHFLKALKSQVDERTEGLERENLILAYTPLWARGSTATATQDDVLPVHRKIRYDTEVGGQPILCGAPVKPADAQELIRKDTVDGFLLDGPTLTVDLFNQILESSLRGAERWKDS